MKNEPKVRLPWAILRWESIKDKGENRKKEKGIR
jgi:hypothetical protein